MRSLLFLSFFLATSSAGAFEPQCGKASWYSLTSITASGERANPSGMTAAHRTLRMGTKVRVTNFRNGRSVVLRINDRGPFIKGRIIDVTKSAARKLGFLNSGWTRVGVSRVNEKFLRSTCRTRNIYKPAEGVAAPKPKWRPQFEALQPSL